MCGTHEQLLLGNLKTLGDWGCLAAWRMGRVKRRGGEFELKGLHSSEANQLLLFMLLPQHSVLSHSGICKEKNISYLNRRLCAVQIVKPLEANL